MQPARSVVYLLFLLVLLSTYRAAYSFEAITPEAQIPVSAISVLKDPSGKLEFQDILGSANSNRFTKLNPELQQLDFGFSTDVIWLKLQLSRRPGDPKIWILEIPYLGLDSITLHRSDSNVFDIANDLTYNKKPIFQRFHAFPLELNTNNENFYLRVQSQYAISVPLTLWDVSAYGEAKLRDNFIQAIYYGGLLALGLYNLLLFLSLRERRYLLYVFFATSIGLGMFSGNGYGQLLLWPDSPRWNSVSQAVFLTLGAGFSLLFTQDYLNTKTSLPFCHKILTTFAMIFALMSTLFCLSVATHSSNYLLFNVFMMMGPASALLIFYACIKKLMMGDRSAKYLLIAFGIIWSGVVIATLRVFNLIPSNSFTSYSVQIGSAFEMLLISFALANQINIDRIRRKAAENRHEQYVQFSSLISHEFRTPLNVIESQAALLEREHANGLDNLRTRTHVIMSAVQHLSHLFTRWTQADKLQNFITKANPAAIDLHLWLGNVVDRCRQFYSTHLIELEIDPDVPNIVADKELLQIALMNLIDNAHKYSPAGSDIQVGVITQKWMTGIFVADMGMGIPDEDYDKIFNERIRLGNAKNTHGLGLGLAIVKRIMELHAGRVEITSKLDKGTTFTLWFPNMKEN